MPTDDSKSYYGLNGYPPYEVYQIDENVMNPGGIPDEAAQFWLDDYLIPVTPHTFKINNNNSNESDQLVDGDPITIPKRDKAQSISIDFMFPFYFYRIRDPYNCFTTSKFVKVKDLTDWLWNIKAERKPLVLTVIYVDGHKLNIRVMLDEYTYTQSAENASDYDFSLTFTEYQEALNQEVDMELKTTLARHNIRSLRSIGGPTPLTPITYETVTGKHEMTWEEMKGQMEAWLKGEYETTFKDVADKKYTDFDQAFKEWWESDEDRKQLHRPDTNTELKNWWIDFMQKSDEEQAIKNKMAEIEAWLAHEVEQITEEPPKDFWERFKLWWRNDPDRLKLHRPRDQEELFNWWDDFKKLSEQEQSDVKKMREISDWLEAEVKKISDHPPEDFWERLKLWWAQDPSHAQLHCPDNQTELFAWWDDFMKLTEDDEKAKADLEAWLNAEMAKLTDKPPATFKEKFEMWWKSDPERGNSMHMPTTDEELLNWWRDFQSLIAIEEANKRKMADIQHWLRTELDRYFNDTPDDFWEGFKLWWNSDETRKSTMHCPDNDEELIAWWDDFMEKNKENEETMKEIEAWIDREVKEVSDNPPETFKEKFELWWKHDPERAEKEIPDTQEEILAWWEEFSKAHI